MRRIILGSPPVPIGKKAIGVNSAYGTTAGGLTATAAAPLSSSKCAPNIADSLKSAGVAAMGNHRHHQNEASNSASGLSADVAKLLESPLNEDDITDWNGLLSSDTVDTDELEAELKRQKRKKAKKDKKHKRNKKSKKRKKKRQKSYSSIDSLSDVDLHEAMEALRHYTPPPLPSKETISSSLEGTGGGVSSASQRSSSNAYFGDSSVAATAGSVGGIAPNSSNSVSALGGSLQVILNNMRHRSPTAGRSKYASGTSPHTPPMHAGGGAASRSSRYLSPASSSATAASSNKDDLHLLRVAGATSATSQSVASGNHSYHSRHSAAAAAGSASSAGAAYADMTRKHKGISPGESVCSICSILC